MRIGTVIASSSRRRSVWGHRVVLTGALISSTMSASLAVSTTPVGAKPAPAKSVAPSSVVTKKPTTRTTTTTQPDSQAPVVPLVGTFRVAQGACNPSTHAVTGSYFRLIFPKGSVKHGMFFENTDSACTDKSFTTLSPGKQGGLVAGSYQPDPKSAFSSTGGGTARAIVAPVDFASSALAAATNSTDPQTGRSVPTPSISSRGGVLSGQLAGFSTAWRNSFMNQGSPKPNGGYPGLTTPVSGTYNARTHRYTMTWTSLMVGGPFTGFIGYWHLQGTFKPAT